MYSQVLPFFTISQKKQNYTKVTEISQRSSTFAIIILIIVIFPPLMYSGYLNNSSEKTSFHQTASII